MEFAEKIKMRIEHWLQHTANHIQEYETFAEKLEKFGHKDAATPIREMAEKTAQ